MPSGLVRGRKACYSETTREESDIKKRTNKLTNIAKHHVITRVVWFCQGSPPPTPRIDATSFDFIHCS
ncbi:hypothetical protein AG1IA_08341 [Rhizoctonia solani AG-1 IA]|uniref:Uncharacterized protein n=1 Tax=Thanatephorus cucumeris (strain AG1-IA) TaxID=983506 RepID=L8WMQ3_THACA|nr:hypothetical protein AG1IA_08341 [Rhizoctonia solani AG-1 IA]